MVTVKVFLHIDLLLSYLLFLVVWEYRTHIRFESRGTPSPGIGGARGAASAISHVGPKKTESIVFELWMQNLQIVPLPNPLISNKQIQII